MPGCSRRAFIKSAALTSLGWVNGCASTGSPRKSSVAVVVIGGGFAGATAAKYLRLLDSDMQVTLIEPKREYISCPGSNWLFADLMTLSALTVDYQALQSRYGIKVLHETVTAIDAEQQRLWLGKQPLRYDRLILAPGIDFRWDSLAGYHQETAQVFPHAWQAGPQTLLLKQQLQAMDDGDVVLISVPAEPYRCPPGPYERASMIAYWLQRYKPKSKLLILDAKTAFSKQKLFEAGWARYFGYGTANSLIEWHTLTDNPLEYLDSKTHTLHTYFGDKFKAKVLNIIPPQQAGSIARQAGLCDASGWCPVNSLASVSRLHDSIHIIGDAAQYAPIPKSAFAANSEAKTCAQAVVSLIREQPLPAAHWLNTCYSLITPEHGISVAGVYKIDAEQKISAVKEAGGMSRLDDADAPGLEAKYAQAVYRSLLKDSFA